MIRHGLLAVCWMILGAATCAVAQDPVPTTQPATSDQAAQAALEEKFARTMTGTTFVGHFTVEGEATPPKEEHYTITGVAKLHGDLWLIRSRIQFGSKDVTVPMILPVKWAGDTPIISVTDVGVPGIGTYTARVVIYGDHYAGVWFGSAAHRGELFGKIEHSSTTQPSDK